MHTINFIDHYANPGFLQDKTISEFNFLKYSDTYWKKWAGNNISYTNRVNYLFYTNLCEHHKFNYKFIGENYRPSKSLPHHLIHHDIIKKYPQNLIVEDLQRYQRGTLVIH